MRISDGRLALDGLLLDSEARPCCQEAKTARPRDLGSSRMRLHIYISLVESTVSVQRNEMRH